MDSNPQESLENPINTMDTLLGVHPIVPWNTHIVFTIRIGKGLPADNQNLAENKITVPDDLSYLQVASSPCRWASQLLFFSDQFAVPKSHIPLITRRPNTLIKSKIIEIKYLKI